MYLVLVGEVMQQGGRWVVGKGVGLLKTAGPRVIRSHSVLERENTHTGREDDKKGIRYRWHRYAYPKSLPQHGNRSKRYAIQIRYKGTMGRRGRTGAKGAQGAAGASPREVSRVPALHTIQQARRRLTSCSPNFIGARGAGAKGKRRQRMQRRRH